MSMKIFAKTHPDERKPEKKGGTGRVDSPAHPFFSGYHAQRGQTLMIVALALVVLLGFAALVIDGGRLFIERRHAQNAADNAALAAAYAKVNGQDITAAAMKIALRNGYSNTADMTVVVNNPPAFGKYAPPNPNANNYIEVIITSRVMGSLVRLVYAGVMEITARAISFTEVGAGSPGGGGTGGYGILALNPTKDKAMESSGSSTIHVVGGGIYLNSSHSKALVSSGSAGIVADSKPEREYEETINKAAALMRAIDIAEEGVHGGQTYIACPGAVVAFLLKVLEESADEGDVQVLEHEVRGRPAHFRLRITQEKPEGIPIDRHRMRTRLPLLPEMLREEGLQQRREIGRGSHRWPSVSLSVSRRLASSSSSGTASRYQYVSLTWACPR